MTRHVGVDDVRRRLLIGSAAYALLVGCGGGTTAKEKKPREADGPVIIEQGGGNAVTAADVAALVSSLNAAFDDRDLQRLLELTGTPLDPSFEEHWSHRLENFERLDLVEGQFFVGEPDGRGRNASGGPLEYRGDVVFAHQVRGCDAREVVEVSKATFTKASAEAPLKIDSIGLIEGFAPAIWDIATVDALVTDHTIIVYRPQDKTIAQRSAASIEAGAKRAFGLMPRPEGVDKILIAIVPKDVGDTLWDGPASPEALGAGYPHEYLDPGELAKGQSVPVAAEGQAVGTARIAIFTEKLDSQQWAEDTACHEIVHALACQWGMLVPAWAAEGLAKWGELKTRGGDVLPQRDAVRRAYAGFRKRMNNPRVKFYADDPGGLNYECASATFAYLDSTAGTARVLEVASALYRTTDADQLTAMIGVDQDGLFAATQKWLDA